MKIYLAYALHDSSSDRPATPYKSKKAAIKDIHEHFLSRGFEIRDGKPFDPDHDDGGEGGFECFGEDWKIKKGLVSRFTHCGGDGPLGWIEKVKLH